MVAQSRYDANSNQARHILQGHDTVPYALLQALFLD